MGTTEADLIAQWYSYMGVSQATFSLTLSPSVSTPPSGLMDTLKSLRMVHHWRRLVSQGLAQADASLDKSLADALEAELAAIDAKVELAKAQEGDDEVRELLTRRATVIALAGADVDLVKEATDKAREKTVALGQKLDLCFMELRVGLFFGATKYVVDRIAACKAILAEVGDWERRNRLKVYEGLHLLTQRDYKSASALLLDSIATFTATEILTYKEFVELVVITAVISLDRIPLRDKVIKSPEILQVVREVPDLFEWASAIYDCKYAEYFQRLANIAEASKRNRYLAPHAKYFTREARILAYRQFLISYRSVTFESMSRQFGVTPAFLDMELSRFVSSGRIYCAIDHVAQIVVTTRAETKNDQFAETIRKGDALLARVQKLSRVISL